MQHRGLLRNGGAGDLIVLGHGVVGGDVAHDQAGRGLGRQAQRHGGANPGIDGVPVLQRLQVQGVAGDGVQIGGIPHVDHHRVAQAVLLPAVQQEGVLIHPSDSAPIGRGAQAGGRFFVSGLRGRGGDRQHGGAEDQGQALQNPFFHSRSSFPMLSGEHLLRLPVLTQGSGKKFPSKAEFLTNIFEAPRRALYPSLRAPASRSGWFPPWGSPPPARADPAGNHGGGDSTETGRAAARRPRGILLPQGAASTGDAPPILFLSAPKRERAAPGVREKALLAATLHVRAKLLYGGRRERVPACFRQTADGRGGVTQRFGGLIPAARVCLGSGCKEGFDQLLFSCLALRRSQDFRHQCSTGSSFRAFRFATRWPGGGRQRRLSAFVFVFF